MVKSKMLPAAWLLIKWMALLLPLSGLVGCASISREEARRCIQVYAREIDCLKSVPFGVSDLHYNESARSLYIEYFKNHFKGTAVIGVRIERFDSDSDILPSGWLLHPKNASGQRARIGWYHFSPPNYGVRLEVGSKKNPPWFDIRKVCLRLDREKKWTYGICRMDARSPELCLMMFVDAQVLAEQCGGPINSLP